MLPLVVAEMFAIIKYMAKTLEEISKFKSRKEWEDYVWSKIAEEIKKLKSENEVSGFLKNLLGAGERKTMIKRAAALLLIQEGRKYREIEEILWISPSTISSIKKSAKGSLGYQARKNLGKPTAKGRIQKKDIKKGSGFPWPPITGRGRWRFLYYQR